MSRHPNFAGEILCWAGICLAALPPALARPWPYALAPALCFGFTCAAMLGEAVLMTERKHNHRFSRDAAFCAWRAETPLLLRPLDVLVPARLAAVYAPASPAPA